MLSLVRCRRVLHLPVGIPSHHLLTLIIFILFIIFADLVWLGLLSCRPLFALMRVNISNYCFLRWRLFLVLSWSYTVGSINFSKSSLQGLQLCRSQTVKFFSNAGSHESVELAHTFIGDVSHILKVVLDTLK